MNSFIEILNQWGGNFLNFAWLMLWQSSLLIVALFAFEYLFRRKVRASIRYALWLVVLVKLCVPPTFALPTSPAWWLHKTSPPIVAKPAPHYTVTYDSGPLPETSLVPLPAYVPPKPAIAPAAWLLMASTTVSIFLLGWLLVRWWQITRDIRRAKTSERLVALADEAQRFAGTKFKVPVKLTRNPMSPAVCGLFRPAILIPQSLEDTFSDEQLRAVLLHELIHLRRRDVWLNFVQAFLQIFYWWHPLVWLANARIRRVREEAVDDSVMLALRDDAESYAPTLLEVAKLALNRPLASLGLVGILESRHALRQRIERLVDFHPPRKAGLTLASLLGILAFTAVAVPMGDKPAPVEKSPAIAPAEIEGQSLTVKVNPEIFIRNVKAQAKNDMYSTNDDYTDILLDILRCEGVDSTPPHGLAFNTKSGEITTQNTPEQLELFRQVIEQLNRADGKCELPLRNNFHRKSVLIEARIYQMPAADFKTVVSDLQFYKGSRESDAWWSVSPEKFKQFVGSLESSSLQLIQRPRILTGSGMPAFFWVGNGTNGVEFDCKPIAEDGFVDLTLQSTVISGLPANTFTNHFGTKAAAEDHGGIVVRVENFNGGAGSNLLVAISVEIVTNNPPTEAGGSGQINPRIETNADLTTTVTGILTDPNFRTIINALKQQTGADTLPEPDVVTTIGHEINRISTDNISVPLAQTNKTSEGRQEIIRKLQTIRWDTLSFEAVPLSEVTRTLHEESKRVDPEHRGINFMINPNPDQSGPPTIDPLTGVLTTNTAIIDPSLIDMPITINPPLTNISLGDVLDGLVMVAPEPIHYSVEDYAIVFSAGKPPSPLYSRHFRIDAGKFMAAMQYMPSIKTNSVLIMAKDFFKTLGVDLDVPGKSVFFNDGLGELFVRATATDLDTIENALEVFNRVVPQIHIKAYFLEVPKGTSAGLKNVISVTNQAIQSNQVAGLVGILTDKNFKTVLRNLETRPGVETLAEPEVVTTSGRQTQMRATTKVDIFYDRVFTNIVPLPLEIGPVLDVVPYVLSDGYTINLTVIPSLTEFLGYDTPAPTNTTAFYNRFGEKISRSLILPRFTVRQVVVTLNLWDNQTAIISGLPKTDYVNGKEVFDETKSSEKELLVFITATIVDPAGNRIHTEEELPFAKDGIPPQPK